jgi:hypothetical protein
MYLFPYFSQFTRWLQPDGLMWKLTNQEWWVCISRAYLVQFGFCTGYSSSHYEASFLTVTRLSSFSCCFWTQPVCSVYDGSDVLIVVLAFWISIPLRNPDAGVQETGPLENGRKSGTPQLVHTETSAEKHFRQARSTGPATETSKT